MKHFIFFTLPWVVLFSWFIYSTLVLISPKIRDKIANYNVIVSIPSVFVSIGLLGTFLGITAGLLEFNVDASNITMSIEELLDGLKTAMFTSIAGIMLSIIFGLRIKIFTKEPDSLEYLELVRMNENLSAFTDSFSTTYHQAIVEALQDTLGKFNNIFVEYIDQLVESNFDKLTTSIDNLTQWQSDYKQEIIDIKEAYGQLVERHTNFVDNTQIWVNQLDQIAGQSSQLKKIVDEFNEAFKDNGNLSKIVLQLNEASQNLNSTSNTLKNQTDKLNNTQDNIDNWAEQLAYVSDATAQITDHLNTIKGHRLTDLQELDKKFVENIGRSLASFDELIKKYVELLKKS